MWEVTSKTEVIWPLGKVKDYGKKNEKREKDKNRVREKQGQK